jgi:hypothetical protein
MFKAKYFQIKMIEVNLKISDSLLNSILDRATSFFMGMDYVHVEYKDPLSELLSAPTTTTTSSQPTTTSSLSNITSNFQNLVGSFVSMVSKYGAEYTTYRSAFKSVKTLDYELFMKVKPELLNIIKPNEEELAMINTIEQMVQNKDNGCMSFIFNNETFWKFLRRLSVSENMILSIRSVGNEEKFSKLISDILGIVKSETSDLSHLLS